MSFDLALDKGDLVIGADGDVGKVRNTSKLSQDVLKVLHTPIGSNPYQPNSGSDITILNIGTNISQEFAETRVEASILATLTQLQAIQFKQKQVQVVTPEETIADLSSVVAERDPNDPRQFNIGISVLTEALSDVTLRPFTISTVISGDKNI